MSRSRRAWNLFLLTRLAGLAIDLTVVALAYVLAFLLRFDFTAPRWGWRAVALSFVTVGAAYAVSLVVTGCYRLAWRRFSLRDLWRFAGATTLVCVVLTALRYFTPVDNFAHIRPPYSITVISFVLATVGLVAWRIIWSWFALVRVKDEDLMERSVRRMDSSVAEKFFRGRTVLVTGAGGSIGSEIVRQLAAMSPKLLVLVERSENALYEIDRELSDRGNTAAPWKPLMVDINDIGRMREIFAEYRPEVVLHAAAYKHVPMVEANPREGERNNTEATRQLAELAKEFGVARFVLISTDKAVNPVSVMGRTKLAAEQAIMSMNEKRDPSAVDLDLQPRPSYCAVRFGNVLGSSGSVVPLFREQIAAKRPVTVTHPEMKRYFMNIDEAVGLVLQAATRSEAAIYTLDMGKPVRILDLAEDMIRQAGYKPYVDIPIVFTGIRPGEKLFEELDVSEKSAYRTDMARIYITK